jgi:hypothetical protein
MRTSYLFEMNGRTLLRRVRLCGSRQGRVSARREERTASVVRSCICASFSAGSAFVLPRRLAQVGGSQTRLGLSDELLYQESDQNWGASWRQGDGAMMTGCLSLLTSVPSPAQDRSRPCDGSHPRRAA